ncbi:SEP10 protein, partial [Dromaius novaehollandiae]|nr:SEP10 protein [Dromaius novaehollandiae]
QNDGYRSLSLSGHVGFDSLPDQLVNKSIKQGFCFNILCIGKYRTVRACCLYIQQHFLFENRLQSGFKQDKEYLNCTYIANRIFILLLCSSFLMCLLVKRSLIYQPIVDYIDAQFEAYLQEELKIKRSLHSYHDTRIHVCLYFTSPTGHSLKTLDLLTMKSLDSKVNIIPIIGKADSISKTELQKFKIKLMSELVSNGIQIYQFPTDDETVSKINAIMNGHLPFAVVGSTEEVKVGNKMVKARQYPWGIVQVENENHCDFVRLREMLICTNMEDLREQTHARHYELYRRCRLEEMGFRDTGPENKPVSLQEAYEAKRHEFYIEMQRKEEEMRQVFVQRVKEKEAILKEAEQEIQAKFEHLKRLHQEERLKLEKNRRVLEDEMAMFIKKKATAELLQTQALVSTPVVSLKKDKDRK